MPADGVAHEGPCSNICLGFGYRDNLTRGPDYRTKLGELQFVIDPLFRGRRCPCHGGQIAEDGSAFGRGEYQCLEFASNPSGVCEGCDRASKLHVARQRRYYRCNRSEVCERRSASRKRVSNDSETPSRVRRANAPAGSDAARRHAPAYVLGNTARPPRSRSIKSAVTANVEEDSPTPAPEFGPALLGAPLALAMDGPAAVAAAAPDEEPVPHGPSLPAPTQPDAPLSVAADAITHPPTGSAQLAAATLAAMQPASTATQQ